MTVSLPNATIATSSSESYFGIPSVFVVSEENLVDIANPIELTVGSSPITYLCLTKVQHEDQLIYYELVPYVFAILKKPSKPSVWRGTLQSWLTSLGIKLSTLGSYPNINNFVIPKASSVQEVLFHLLGRNYIYFVTLDGLMTILPYDGTIGTNLSAGSVILQPEQTGGTVLYPRMQIPLYSGSVTIDSWSFDGNQITGAIRG
jgi:hypothetical protein